MTREGIEMIKRFEGFRSEAYKCPAGMWTIGYGHTQGVGEGMRISEQEAEKMLLNDLTKVEAAVRRLVGDIEERKIDALVSLTYNIGISAFMNSTLCRKVKANKDDKTIASEFGRWIYANRQVLPGLAKRRKEESMWYFS